MGSQAQQRANRNRGPEGAKQGAWEEDQDHGSQPAESFGNSQVGDKEEGGVDRPAAKRVSPEANPPTGQLITKSYYRKDDICFRRKRGREVEDPGDKEHGSKRTKSVSKVEAEVKKNPFKVDLKNDAKRVEKRRSRSKSPSLSHQKAAERRSKAQDHGSETRRKSRERRPSRSRSPRHSSRHEERRSRGSSSRPNRRRSCSPSPRLVNQSRH